MLVSEGFGNLIDPVVRKVFFTTYEEKMKSQDYISKLCSVETSKRSTERILGLGGLSDVPVFTGTFAEDTPSQQYMKTVTHEERGKKIVIERRLLEDDLYGEIKRYPQQSAIALFRTHQKLLATIFNNAFTGTDGSDSVSLCNASHGTLSPDGVTQSNRVTTALTHANLIAAMNLMDQFRDDRGELWSAEGSLLLVPLNLRRTALEITESELKPGTADNDINIAGRSIQGKSVKVLVWNRLTDTNNWFLIDEDMMKLHLHWFNRVKPELKMHEDFDRRAAEWSIYWRGQVAFSDWRWILGAEVT